MQKAIFIQLFVGLLLGGSLGAVVGYFGKCATGTCVLMAGPGRGALLGAMIGGLFAFSTGVARPAAGVAGPQASAHIDSQVAFERDVLNADKPVLVDFYADWCGPCRMLAPVIEELAREYEGRAVVSKVNVDQLGQVAGRYGVRSIPTVILFKNGQEVKRLVGVQRKGAYERELDGLLDSGAP